MQGEHRGRKRHSSAGKYILLAVVLTAAVIVTDRILPGTNRYGGAYDPQSGETADASGIVTAASEGFQAAEVPAYNGRDTYAEINGNVPFFTAEDLNKGPVSFEAYSSLDSLGRCGTCWASVGTDLMPDDERGEIDTVWPTGYRNRKYSFIDRNFLYNRCHLIAYGMTGENANPRNLITGTRYLNVAGMLPFETAASDAVRRNEEHVLYRVTPVFEGRNLVCTGLLMEAQSVEYNSVDVKFCVFVYNVQPGVTIDYATGENSLTAGSSAADTEGSAAEEDTVEADAAGTVKHTHSAIVTEAAMQTAAKQKDLNGSFVMPETAQ
ncbi:MAG: DNA/RNA non-specific endonuclease [Lachnospiraceae bacterium]|jgi:DNA-entry nuclease|nr:DNA/RNA non-specific endonuclease [Lachnospiraceae bacterium]